MWERPRENGAIGRRVMQSGPARPIGGRAIGAAPARPIGRAAGDDGYNWSRCSWRGGADGWEEEDEEQRWQPPRREDVSSARGADRRWSSPGPTAAIGARRREGSWRASHAAEEQWSAGGCSSYSSYPSQESGRRGGGAAHSSAARKRGRGTQRLLVILDMNGVLISRKNKSNPKVRPHLSTLISTLRRLSDRVAVAVWSSMMTHNLYPLVDFALGDFQHELMFIWDNKCCTELRVPEMRKPLLRKDLVWLERSEWSHFAPDNVLLIDDDPVKCTENPEGTAVHPTTFDGSQYVEEDDSELLKLARYIDALSASSSESVPEFVLQHPYDSFDFVNPPAFSTEPTAKRRRSHAGAADEDDLVDHSFDEPAPLEAAYADDDAGDGDFVDLGAYGDEGEEAAAGGASDGYAAADGAGADGFDARYDCEAYWPEDDVWLPAKILKMMPDEGTIRVQWEADCSISTVPVDYVWQRSA